QHARENREQHLHVQRFQPTHRHSSPSEPRAYAKRNPGCFHPGFPILRVGAGLDDLNRVSLQALLALHDSEGDLLAFLQRLEAAALDGTEMDEEVLTAFRGNEAEALGVVEPLHSTALTIRHL